MWRHYWNTTNFIPYSWLRSGFPGSAGGSIARRPEYLLEPIHPANIDLWNVVASHSRCKLPRQSAVLLQFLLPYVWLNKTTVLSLSIACSRVYGAKQGWICCLQTESYIIYSSKSLDWCSTADCGVRSLSLLHILVPRQAQAAFSLIDLLQGRALLVCCGEKQSCLRRPPRAWVCLSARGREKLFSCILQWRAPGEALHRLDSLWRITTVPDFRGKQHNKIYAKWHKQEDTLC